MADEVKVLVDKEEFDEAICMLNNKDELMRKFLSAKQTISLNSDEQIETEKLDMALLEKEQSNIEFLGKLKSEVGAELRKTSKNLKLNAAYSVRPEKPGEILDFTE